MKTIYKLLSLVLILTVTVSCTRDKVSTENLDNRTNIIYYSATSASLNVEDGAANTIDIIVASSSLPKTTIPYSVSVDPSSTAVEGVDFDIVSSTEFVAGEIVSNYTVEAYFEPSSEDGKTVVLNLVSEAAEVGVVNQFTLSLFKLCEYNGLTTTSYTAAVTAFDADAPGYDVVLSPVAGTTNQWTVTTGWGENFVAWATGDPGYAGLYVYSGTITLNSDYTIDFVGDDGWATGGTGVYAPCPQTFSYTLTQGLFTSPFTVDVVLSPMN